MKSGDLQVYSIMQNLTSISAHPYLPSKAHCYEAPHSPKGTCHRCSLVIGHGQQPYI
jgi:hypothetical protein